jgi:flagellar protein FliO/FliZ
MKLRLLTLTLLLVPQLSVAAEAAAEPNLLYAALKMVAALAVIIGLLLLLYAASRKGFGVLPKARGGSIKVLETKPLGGKKFLCLVSVRGEEMLLGLSNERIECLSKLTPAKDFSAALQEQLEEGQT